MSQHVDSHGIAATLTTRTARLRRTKFLTAKNGNSPGDASRWNALAAEELAVSDKLSKTDKKKDICCTRRREPPTKVPLASDEYPSLRPPLPSQACTTSRCSTMTAKPRVQSVPARISPALAQLRQRPTVSSKTTGTFPRRLTFRLRLRDLLATLGLRYLSSLREACRQPLERRASQVGLVLSVVPILRPSPTSLTPQGGRQTRALTYQAAA
jgi:hypothetical protein